MSHAAFEKKIPAKCGTAATVAEQANHLPGAKPCPGPSAGTALPDAPVSPAAGKSIEPRFGYDLGRVRTHPDGFAAVRFHPSALEVTAPRRARAVTIGQDVYFHPGEFQPGTPEGEKLIAHELAHTLQTRPSVLNPDLPSKVHSAEALERNADELAAGRVSQPLPAPAGAALPQPFPGEPWYMEVRRLAVLQRYRQLLRQLQSGLETGALLEPAERIRPRDRIQNVLTGRIVSRAERNAIVGRLVLNLALLITQLETGAAPASWDEPMVEGYNLSAADVHGEGDSTITDAVTYYAHWSHDHGHPFAEVHDEEAYIFALLASAVVAPTDRPTPPGAQEEQTDRAQREETPSASPSRHPFEGGHSPVAHIVVEDPEHAPLTYHPAVGGTIPVRGYLADVYYDGHQHYYYYRGRRINLPDFH